MNHNFDLKELISAVETYAKKRGGKIYAPIMHPEFSRFPSQHGHERFDAIVSYVPKEARTLLDIGSHWGYFAHRFEELGLKVTAAENSAEYLYFLRAIRELCGKKFDVWSHSVFDLQNTEYDVILALNIFHHFIKKETIYNDFVCFLNKLRCKTIIFQPHNPKEGQMTGSFRNFTPQDFVEFVAANTGLTFIKKVAAFEGRPIFIIS
jgi:2-polyprenyl-3-methyl-5-hydroxy-6-metoxy-1,4-benzoquinol methylase